MVRRSNYAAVEDVQIMLRKEECVEDTGQKSSYAAVKDAQIMLRKEECACGTVQR